MSFDLTLPGYAQVLQSYQSDSGEALERISCPICYFTDSDLVLRAHDRLYGAPDEYHIVRCTRCRLRFVNPRPTTAALAAHYKPEYLSFAEPGDYPRWLRPFVTNWGLSVVKRRLREIERALGRLEPGTEVLDVGCGLNGFLYYLRGVRETRGIGVDLSEQAVRFVREKQGMPIVQGTLQSATFASARFDLVTMNQYLEHDANPRATLAEARRILKPGGHLAIEIPDPSGWPARLFKSSWANLDLPRHVVFFERGTLRTALASEGLELVSYARFGLPLYTGISLYFSLQRHNRVGNAFGALLLAACLGLPFLPFFPWCREFGFAIARAR